MVSYKRILVFLSVLLVAVAFFNAVEASDSRELLFNAQTINGTARPGETLEYTIFVTNVGSKPIDVSMNTLFPGTPEITPNRFVIQPRQKQEVYVGITIHETDRPRNVNIKILFFDRDAGSSLGSINLEGRVIEPLEPFKTVTVDYVGIEPSVVDPREEVLIRFRVNNPVETTTVPVIVTSDIKGFETYSTMMEISEGINYYEIHDLEIPEETVSGEYTFNIQLKFSELTIAERSLPVELSGYTLCRIEESGETSLFGRFYTASVRNMGTEETVCVVSTPMSSAERILVKEATEGYAFEDGKIIWSVSLESNQKTEVEYYVSFVPLLALPFLILATFGLYWYFTRKMWIKKELIDYKRHSGFMDLKIQLRLKNLTNKELLNVKAFDPIPAFIKEVRDYGTIPGKIKKREGRKVVEWDVGDLKPKEERVFSYKVRTSLEVLGNINFTPAEVEFSDEKGKGSAKSNVLTIAVK